MALTEKRRLLPLSLSLHLVRMKALIKGHLATMTGLHMLFQPLPGGGTEEGLLQSMT